MFRLFPIFCLLYLILPFNLVGQSRDLDALELNHINGATSIEFRRDDKDLLELKKAVGDKQVVMLGEFTHQEGTTFKAKARIVRYLIENMGFQVVALENSMGEVYRINQQARDKEDFLTFITLNDFSANNEEYYFWRYIYSLSRPPSKKIDLYGFDVYLGASTFGFWCFLEQEVSYASQSIIKTEDWKNFKTLYARLIDLDKNELNQFKLYTDKLITQLNKLDSDEKVRTAYLIQLLKNLYGFAYFNLYKPPFPSNEALKLFFEEARYYALRDKQMADNLSWIIDKSLSSGKKVIVWSSTYHITRNIIEIQCIDTTSYKPMGQYLWERYPNKIYSIGFVGYDRTIGTIYQKEGIPKNQKKEDYEVKVTNDKGETIGKVMLKTSVAIDTTFIKKEPLASKGSLEFLLHEKNAKFAFVVLSKDLKDKNFYLFPTFDKPYYAKWSGVLDGIYYMDKVEPFHRKALQSYNREINYTEKFYWFWPMKVDCGN